MKNNLNYSDNKYISPIITLTITGSSTRFRLTLEKSRAKLEEKIAILETVAVYK